MARDLPAVFPGENGRKPLPPARDARGRFVAGAPPGPGRPANPYSRWQAALRTAALAALGAGDVQTLVRTLVRLGKRGNLAAVKILFEHVLGPPPAGVHPDHVDADELAVRRSQPTLLDQLALGELPAEADPAAIPAAAEDEPEETDPLQPSLRQTLAWALEDLAQAQYALRMQRPSPPNPAAGWETFAASRLEFDEAAAVATAQLLLSYLEWCASHGEPPLEEAKVMAWLQDHGATVRRAPLSQTALVVGVRVVA